MKTHCGGGGSGNRHNIYLGGGWKQARAKKSVSEGVENEWPNWQPITHDHNRKPPHTHSSKSHTPRGGGRLKKIGVGRVRPDSLRLRMSQRMKAHYSHFFFSGKTVVASSLLALRPRAALKSKAKYFSRRSFARKKTGPHAALCSIQQ